MAEGRSRERWDHTANVMALLANCHQVKGKVFSPRDFNPYLAKEETPVLNRASLRALMLQIGGVPVTEK